MAQPETKQEPVTTRTGSPDIAGIMNRYRYQDNTRKIIERENLMPEGLLVRLHSCFPDYSGIIKTGPFLFTGKQQYAGLKGFREIVDILQKNGIRIGHLSERELFIRIYRFLATRHVLNHIDWDNFERDSLFQLVFPQPGMIPRKVVDTYRAAGSDDEHRRIIDDHLKKINPHDGKQLLNKPRFINDEGGTEIVHGSQHKYPPCQLIFDKTTQSCFAYCTYCFRHAQVRGDDDMFTQEDIGQVHEYLRRHKEVTDILITGGDAGYLTYRRLEQYVDPLTEDPELRHIRTLRLGSRALTYHPEMVLNSEYDRYLRKFRELTDNGIQVVWMAHFSTPGEVLNPSTIAAIRRLKTYGVTIRSQSPVMNHISLFQNEQGEVDINRSARNWIDLGNVLGMLGVGFHSMYFARPTGEHHYFSAPLAGILKVFQKVYRELPSVNRPSRYITMTSSAGKVSLLGVLEVDGRKAFALKFNEARNMEWMDRVYLAEYDEKEDTIDHLKPFESEKYFYEDELEQLEMSLSESQ